MKTKHVTFWVLVILAIMAAGCSGSPLGDKAKPTIMPTVSGSANVTAEGRIVPKQITNLSFFAAGQVDTISVSEGQQVSKNTPLISLGKREPAEAAVAQAKLAQISAQQQLDQLNRLADEARGQAELTLAAANKAVSEAQKIYDDVNTDDFLNQIDDKKAAVQDAQDTLKDKQESLDKYKNLDSDNQTRKDAQAAVDDALRELHKAERERDLLEYQLDQAKANLDLALGQQKESQRSVDVRSAGPDTDDLALAQTQLDNAKAQLDAAERVLANMDLLAPYDGIVMDTHSVEAGELVAAGQSVITFADTGEWYVETKDLTELDVVKLSDGQKVTVVPDALADVSLDGVVESIGSVYTEKSSDVLYTVRIRLEKPDTRLRWGMTVQLTFAN